MPDTPSDYGTVKNVFFSPESLKNKIHLFNDMYAPLMKQKHENDIVFGFYRLQDDPQKVTIGQSVGKAEGALATKKDIQHPAAYDKPIIEMSFKSLIKNFGGNTEDIIAFISMIKTVQDIKNYIKDPQLA